MQVGPCEADSMVCQVRSGAYDRHMRERIEPRVFLAVNRGGGLATRGLAQPVGAVLAAAAYRLALHPAVLTLAGMLLGIATSAALVVTADDLSGLAVFERIEFAVAVWIGWLLAAALDCADGQLARVARQTSPAGAVLDILCDVLSQAMFVAALAAVASVFHPGVPAAAYAFAGGIWMMVLVTAQLDKDGADVSLLPAESLPLSVLKAPRDLIAQITAAAVAIAVWPAGMLWLIGGLTAVNSIYLFALIARATLRSSSGHESRRQLAGAEVQQPQTADQR